MDGISSIYRRTLWHACVLCIVFGVNSANASTRKHVSMPTAQSVATNPSGPVTRTGNSLFAPGQPLEGEFIPGVDGKKIPVRGILPTIDFSIPRTLSQGKSLLKGGIIGAGVSIGIDWLVGQIGAFVDENSGNLMKNGKKLAPASSLFWCHVNSDTYCNNSAPDRMRLSSPTQFPSIFKAWNPLSELCSATYSIQSNGSQVLIKYINNNPGQCGVRDGSSQITYYRRGSCPQPSYYDSELMSCVESAPIPLEDPDYDLMFDIANQQNAAWLSGLLKDVCANSPSPARCFEEMKQSSALSGPKTVPGETVTKTTNTTGANGVVTQTITNTKNTYNFTYGPTYYDYSKTTQITTSKDGVPVSDETITEPTEPEQEQEPQEEDKQEDPVLCSGQGCDGPAYEDQYTPIEEKKEDYLDDYASRVSSIPIIQALNGLFDINVSGSCPVWTFDYQVPVIGASMPINLVFDYLCLPWFTQYGPWIRAVIYLVAVYAAIRIALL